jgi:lysophospholipase L1-like esterase
MLLAANPAQAQAAPSCPSVPVQGLHLTRFPAAVARGEVVIVAFGSSSTRGARAQDPAHSYPALLQSVLSAAWPRVHTVVVNRGADGEDAADELVRLGRDVIGVRPDLVIWQVGANGALRDVGVAALSRNIRAGVRRLQEAGIDVVLMDNQRSPRILATPRHAVIEQAIAGIAADMGVALFSRGALMDAWNAAGHEYAQFIAADGLHHNDLGYRCVAEALAAATVASLPP